MNDIITKIIDRTIQISNTHCINDVTYINTMTLDDVFNMTIERGYSRKKRKRKPSAIIYICLDEYENIIYIGKTTNHIKNRFQGHISEKKDSKLKQFIATSAIINISIIEVKHNNFLFLESIIQIIEGQIISEFNPRYNKINNTKPV